jgi:hypothetical protein
MMLKPRKLRNIQDDPFAVRGNRETVAGEVLLSYDQHHCMNGITILPKMLSLR